MTKKIKTKPKSTKHVPLPEYLYLTAEQAEAEEAFTEAWAEDPGNCADNPGPWADYPHHNPPGKLESRYMCSGCPLLKVCDDYAKVLKPTHGVWAGKLYGFRTPDKREA